MPRLIVGTWSVDPLPPQLNTAVGHRDLRVALGRAGTETAAVRFRRQLDVGIVREAVAETLALHSSSPDPSVLRRWVDGLSDESVLEKHSSLLGHPARLGAMDAAVLALIAEAQAADDA